METDIQTLDPARQERAKEYAIIRRWLWILEMALGLIYMLFWLLSSWASTIAETINSIQSESSVSWWITLLAVTGSLAIPWRILTLPLSYYSGFILPHRYDLSTQTLKGWISDLIKGGLISIVLGIPLLIGLYGLIRSFPSTWWILAAGGFTLFTVVLAVLAPVLLMPIFYKFKPLGEEYSRLAQKLLELARQAGTHVRGVYTFDMSRRTRAANAGLTGLGRTRRIILSDTLLEEFSEPEIETVLAHELAHHVNKDIPLQLIFQTSFNFMAFYIASQVLEQVANSLNLSGGSDPGGLPLLTIVFGFLGLITMPVSNALSRWRERLADQYALETTNKPDAFESAMTRLANQNLAEVDPEGWVVFLFYSHPPLRDRIRMAQAFGSKPVST
ncbi:MAG: M48 family metallopeptidase [Anaerolineales bacterium]